MSQQSKDRTSFDAIIIGGGVIGAAVAVELTHRFKSVLLLEAGPRVGEGISSRNSGVLHAGLYYPENSLKSQLCIEGLSSTYAWCKKNEVPHARLGKWIVAQEGEEDWLDSLWHNARACGASGLDAIKKNNGARVLGLEDVKWRSAFFSSQSGIVDAAALTQSYLSDAESRGLILLTNNRVLEISTVNGGYEIRTAKASTGVLTAPVVINAAGLEGDYVAKQVGVTRYEIHPCRGDYFRLRTRQKFKNLIYPVKVPGAPGLGVHVTVDLGGTVRLGPDAEYVGARDDFSLSAEEISRKARKFAHAASRYLPGVRVEDLEYDSCGIRPKLNLNGDEDFVIAEDLPRFFNLVGIESPGLTASLAIARHLIKRI